MLRSKLIDRLQLLKQDELRDFSKFLHSPYYNNSEKVIRLYDYLKMYYPAFESPDLEREQIAGQIFPEWTSNTYKKLSRVMSSLSQLLERFFAVQERDEDELEHYQALLKTYKKRGGDWFFNHTAEVLEKRLTQLPERNTNYYYNQYRLNHERYTHTANARIRTGIESLEKTINNLDLFYFGIKFRYGSEVRFRELYLSEKSDLVLLDEMLRAAQRPVFSSAPFIQIFATIVRLYQTHERAVYDELKNLIFDNFHQFSHLEKFDMITMANNFCIMESNRGKTEYLIEIFELFEYGLQQGIYTLDGHIKHAVFDNIVEIACKLSKYEWVEDFIQYNKKHLREEVRESVLIMAWCRIEFALGNFEKVLELLRDVEFVDVQYSVNAKSFCLRSYYELEDYDILFYDACSAFAKYCRRNKVVSNQFKTLNLNFVSFIKQVHQAKILQTESREELLKKLEETPLPFANWFREKIERDIK